MAYTIETLPGDPVIKAAVWGPLDTTQLMTLFRDSIAACEKVNGPACYILDFGNQGGLKFQQGDNIIQLFLEGFRRILETGLVFCALVSQDKHVIHIIQSIEMQGVFIPLFSDWQEAYSYLNLKLNSVYLKQSLNIRDTQDLEQTGTLEMAISYEPRSLNSLETDHFIAGSVLRLEALGLDKSLLIFPEKGVILGRRDVQGEKPDIDLSLWAAYHLGVSRRHAQLTVVDEKLYLFDLSSANGTFLNGEMLIANHAYLIHHHDEVMLGRLAIQFFFENPS